MKIILELRARALCLGHSPFLTACNKHLARVSARPSIASQIWSVAENEEFSRG